MPSHIMIALVGEQPLPVLLPIIKAHTAVPNLQIALAHTARTERVARNVRQFVKDRIGLMVQLWPVDPYRISDIHTALQCHIREQQWMASEIVYNLTGGTKAMILAAYEVARASAARYVYLESERNESVLYQYEISGEFSRLQDKITLPALLDIHDYLHVHGFYDFRPSPPDHSLFFAAIRDEIVALIREDLLHQFEPGVDLHGNRQIDIDLMLRLKNQVAIAEIKSGNKVNSLEWIKQLNTASRPTTLGTYTKRLGILSRQADSQYIDIAALQGIDVVTLDEFETANSLTENDRVKLRGAIKQLFEPVKS